MHRRSLLKSLLATAVAPYLPPLVARAEAEAVVRCILANPPGQ